MIAQPHHVQGLKACIEDRWHSDAVAPRRCARGSTLVGQLSRSVPGQEECKGCGSRLEPGTLVTVCSCRLSCICLCSDCFRSPSCHVGRLASIRDLKGHFDGRIHAVLSDDRIEVELCAKPDMDWQEIMNSLRERFPAINDRRIDNSHTCILHHDEFTIVEERRGASLEASDSLQRVGDMLAQKGRRLIMLTVQEVAEERLEVSCALALSGRVVATLTLDAPSRVSQLREKLREPLEVLSDAQLVDPALRLLGPDGACLSDDDELRTLCAS